MIKNLKLAAYSLAAQSRILKRWEKSKHNPPEFRKGIHNKRVYEIRSEARSTHIALGFIRGRDLSEMELPLRPINKGHISTKNMTRTAPNWARIEELIREQKSFAYFDNEQDMWQQFAEFKETGFVGSVE